MSYLDPAETKTPEDSSGLGYMQSPGVWSHFPKGSGFCIFDNMDPTTKEGKTPLVLVRVEGRKMVFMCGCSQCINSTKEDKKNAKVRYLTFTGKWSGVHAHGR